MLRVNPWVGYLRFQRFQHCNRPQPKLPVLPTNPRRAAEAPSVIGKDEIPWPDQSPDLLVHLGISGVMWGGDLR